MAFAQVLGPWRGARVAWAGFPQGWGPGVGRGGPGRGWAHLFPPPLPLPALHLLRQEGLFPQQHQRLSLGCPVLDALLRGGLPLDGITELAGRSSAGKTQLALQLCLAVQLPRQYGGLGAGECRGRGSRAAGPGVRFPRFPSLHAQRGPMPAECRARGLPAGTSWPGVPVNGRPPQGPGPRPP